MHSLSTAWESSVSTHRSKEKHQKSNGNHNFGLTPHKDKTSITTTRIAVMTQLQSELPVTLMATLLRRHATLRISMYVFRAAKAPALHSTMYLFITRIPHHWAFGSVAVFAAGASFVAFGAITSTNIHFTISVDAVVAGAR